jgi:large subunit ribosomal protein L16
VACALTAHLSASPAPPDAAAAGSVKVTVKYTGKGAVDHWVAVVRRGKVMFEVGGIKDDLAKEALRRAASKLPIRTKIVSKEEMATTV